MKRWDSATSLSLVLLSVAAIAGCTDSVPEPGPSRDQIQELIIRRIRSNISRHEYDQFEAVKWFDVVVNTKQVVWTQVEKDKHGDHVGRKKIEYEPGVLAAYRVQFYFLPRPGLYLAGHTDGVKIKNGRFFGDFVFTVKNGDEIIRHRGIETWEKMDAKDYGTPLELSY